MNYYDVLQLFGQGGFDVINPDDQTHQGSWTAIQFIGSCISDFVTVADKFQYPLGVTFSGNALMGGHTIYGDFTSIQLTSDITTGFVIAYKSVHR